MANKYFQQAREAVQAAEQAITATHTPEAQADANEKIKRAKQALSQAFADSSLAERDQLMDMQQTLYEMAEDFSTETK